MGEKLKAARQAAGMTQGELAEKVGCDQRAISEWENGRREPVASTLRRWGAKLTI